MLLTVVLHGIILAYLILSRDRYEMKPIYRLVRYNHIFTEPGDKIRCVHGPGSEYEGACPDGRVVYGVATHC